MPTVVPTTKVIYLMVYRCKRYNVNIIGADRCGHVFLFKNTKNWCYMLSFKKIYGKMRLRRHNCESLMGKIFIYYKQIEIPF